VYYLLKFRSKYQCVYFRCLFYRAKEINACEEYRRDSSHLSKYKWFVLQFKGLLNFVERFALGLGQEEVNVGAADERDAAENPEDDGLAEKGQHRRVAFHYHKNVDVGDGGDQS